MLNKFKDGAWLISIGLIFGGLWYCFWVEPNDEIMTEIMECMDDDRSREAYDSCRNLVVNNRGEKQ